MDREIRAFRLDMLLELRAGDKDLPRIKGHAAVFDVKSEDLGGFREIIRPGAFKKSLEGGADVRALVDHDPTRILGRNKAGTLEVREDKKGLFVDISPGNTSHGRDIVESIRRGDVDSMSFGFRTINDQWHIEDEETVRELLEVDLFDVSPVSFPAYPQTDVAARSMEAWQERGKTLMDHALGGWTKAYKDRLERIKAGG